MERPVTLQRKSFRILSLVIPSVILLFILWVALGSKREIDGDALAVMAAGFALISLVRRIWCSRVVMTSNGIQVVNPLITHSIPVGVAARAERTQGGTLVIVTTSGEEVRSVGFGGSLIDSFVGSAERGAQRVEAHIRSGRRSSKIDVLSKRITTDVVSDVCLLASFVCAVTAAAVGV
ncbi:hypothetical protein [Streptomyces sp. NPDC126499]|uniref:hypothetical protein n=1 Tax=Streptomyces sp. NPDC126499 TaxID=3155314 RepID=UPI0033173E2A